MTEEQVKEVLWVSYEYCYRHDEWVEPVDSALAGMTAAEALRRPTPEGKCVWEIVLHVAVWNDNIVRRIESCEKCRPEEGAWPPLPAYADDRAWEAAKDRLDRSLEGIESLIRDSNLDRLNGPPYGLADLLCRFFHVAYHLGQIVKMRQGVGCQPTTS